MDWTPIIVALITAGGLGGWAALRKSASEADKAAADAANAIMDAAEKAVSVVSRRLEEAEHRVAEAERRIVALEEQVGLWEDWAERVLGVLDQAISLLGDDHAAKLRVDVDAVKHDRP